VAGGWRRPHIEELLNFYSSPNAIRTIKLRRMIWTGHVARMRQAEECTRDSDWQNWR